MGCGYSSCHCCILFKSPRSYHSSAWPPSFQIPVTSFLSLKVSLATRDHLAQLYDRPEVPGNECSLASNNERWNQYPSTLPSGQMTRRDVFLSRLHPIVRTITCLIMHPLLPTLRSLSPSPTLLLVFPGTTSYITRLYLNPHQSLLLVKPNGASSQF